ncbi:MAG: hypothetical protein V1850_03805 [Candidatus Bathyarchaeota archaeon]
MQSQQIQALSGTTFENTTKLIVRHTEKLYFHPRKGQLIIGIEKLRTPRPNNKHLSNMPRSSYHRATNARLVNGSCILTGTDFAYRYNGSYRTAPRPEYQKTKQWRTIWE